MNELSLEIICAKLIHDFIDKTSIEELDRRIKLIRDSLDVCEKVDKLDKSIYGGLQVLFTARNIVRDILGIRGEWPPHVEQEKPK